MGGKHIMKVRLFSASIVAIGMASLAWADTTIVEDNFDSYADQTAFEAVWDQHDNNNFGRISGYLVPDSGIGTPPNDDPPGLEGKGILIGDSLSSGIYSEYDPGFFSIAPSASQSVRVSGDFFDDVAGNKRTTVGLRSNSPANLVEIGYWNANTFDATDPFNAPPKPAEELDYSVPSVGYSYRVQLFESWGGDLVRNPDWQPFELDPVLDIDGVGGVPDGLVTPLDIGQGWHRYSVTISPTEVTFTLDLFRDGLANSEATEGVGTLGVDATVTWEMGLVDVPFDSLRIGGPSGVTSANESVVDNVLLELIDVAVSDNADFDEDTDIDGNDFLIWQRGNGIQAPDASHTDGDANGDLAVNGDDLVIWDMQFGGPPPTAAALATVPEPSSVILLLLAISALAISRSKDR
jgi:hypothetical protein